MKKTDKGKGPKSDPSPAKGDWKLLENAERIEFDLPEIEGKDRLGLRQEGFKEGRMHYEYIVAISRKVSQVVQEAAPGSKVTSVQMSGEELEATTIKADSIKVTLIFKRGKAPEFSAEITAGENEKSRIKEGISRIKRELEG